MALIRTTFFFTQEGYGWTESFWTNAGGIAEAVLLAKSDVLAHKRILMSGNETRLEYVRHSVEGVFRDATYNGYLAGGLKGDISNGSDAPTTALLVTSRDITGSGSRRMFLRGIWDGVVTLGGRYNPTTLFVQRFNDWANELVQGSWGWLSAFTPHQADIESVVSNPSGTLTVKTIQDCFIAPFNVNMSVHISGVKGADTLNGQQTGRAKDMKTFETRNRIAIFPYTAGGRLKWNEKAFRAFAGAQVQRVVRRAPGRPSFLSPGKQRVRRAS